MNLRVLTLVCLLLPMVLIAQKKEKPTLLIYGSDVTALSAAIQSARSNVPTVLVMDKPILAEEITTEVLKIEGNNKLDGGIWMGILMEMAMSKNRDDSLAKVVKLDFNPRLARNSIDKFINQLPNLTILKDKSVSKINKGRKKWEVTLSDNQKFDVISIIDASESASLLKTSGLNLDSAAQLNFTPASEMSLELSRTTLAVGALNQTVNVVFLKDILNSEKDNFFDIGRLRNIPINAESIPFRSAFGQAIGATAAYSAFFKTTTKSIDIRKLQSELLTYKARLIPYQDVKINDVHLNAIQKCFLTGFFLGIESDGKYVFNKSGIVRFDDIKEVLNDIYTRSQLWFLDNYRNDDLTWKDLMSLIRFVSFKGDEVEKQIIKDWSTKLKFEGEYNQENKVTREQFAVVTDLFSTAFSKAINLDGSFVK